MSRFKRGPRPSLVSQSSVMSRAIGVDRFSSRLTPASTTGGNPKLLASLSPLTLLPFSFPTSRTPRQLVTPLQ
jgi:hypothetical protein